MYDFIKEGLTFDDVLLVPQYSKVKSRSTDVDISVKFGSLEFSHPVTPANMQTVTGFEMAAKIIDSGGLAILHRFDDIKNQIVNAKYLIGGKDSTKHLAVSIGVQKNDQENVSRFIDVGVKMFCIDIAHGDSQHCTDMISWIKSNYDVIVIAGNVATGDGAKRLWKAGADIVKVGVGPGSLCTTRIETGNGVPQLTALMEVAEAQRQMVELWKTKDYETYTNSITKRHFPFIADGGIKNAGDIVKALCFADMVMVGNLFAGCEETPGKTFSLDGRTYKEYVGSSTHKTSHIEGVAAMVPTKGKYEEVLNKLLEGLRSGCSYQGAHNLSELKDNPTFIRITNAGLKESHPHDVILKTGV